MFRVTGHDLMQIIYMKITGLISRNLSGMFTKKLIRSILIICLMDQVSYFCATEPLNRDSKRRSFNDVLPAYLCRTLPAARSQGQFAIFHTQAYIQAEGLPPFSV